jgi:hypothetical protein
MKFSAAYALLLMLANITAATELVPAAQKSIHMIALPIVVKRALLRRYFLRRGMD